MGLKSWLLAQSLQAGAALSWAPVTDVPVTDVPATDVPATAPKSSALDIARDYGVTGHVPAGGTGGA